MLWEVVFYGNWGLFVDFVFLRCVNIVWYIVVYKVNIIFLMIYN